MCGIIGYTGTENAIPKMTEGLTVLEYRGYDSVGIAAETADGIEVVKCRGRIRTLEEKLGKEFHGSSTCAIGHTRWATHGSPSDVNAHPHRAGKVVLVHNGIIENYRELRAELVDAGESFLSETDTEVAAAVLNRSYERLGDPVAAIRETVARFRGSYAFGILFSDRPEEVYAVRCGSPLILAKGADGYYLASDMTALLPFTKEYVAMEEGETARLTPSGATLYRNSDGAALPLRWEHTDLTPEAAQKGGYPHFMLKEIHEQPEAIHKSVASRIRNGLPDFSADGIAPELLDGIRNIQIVACGSAMHAGLVGARLMEARAGVPASVYIASEYRYYPPLLTEGTLVIVISQSGETADSLAALRYAKSKGIPTLGIVNAVGTTIAREADFCVYTYAGPEIAVATTKGYCTQASVLSLFSLALAYRRGCMEEAGVRDAVRSLAEEAPVAMEEMLRRYAMRFTEIATLLSAKENAFYIGRGMDYALSMESALKLKEISYIHAEAYAAGELKHGTISLIEEGTPVLALSSDPATADKTESNVREVQSRGAEVVLLCREDDADPGIPEERIIRLPVRSGDVTFFSELVAVQMIAYETARLRGCDIDRPRNLAKSVTVE